MPTYNGISYPETDFLDYGYKTSVTSGTGVALPRWQAALVDAIADAGKQMRTTSVSSVAVGTGTKTFVLVNDLPYQAGDVVRVTDTSNSANYMYGTVSSYTQATRTLVLSVASGDTGGSGTIASWNVAVAGLKGSTGATGNNGTNGADGANGYEYASTTSGTSTAYTATFAPSIVALTNGQPLFFIPHTACGANATLNANGIGAKNLKINGAATAANDLLASVPYIGLYDGTNINVLNVGGGVSNQYGYNAVATSGASQTLDFSTYAVQDITLTAACTFTFTLPTVASGKSREYTLILRQNGTGGWGSTWPSNGTVSVWSGTASSSTPPVLNTQANTVTVLKLKQVAASTAVVITVEGTNVGSTNGNVAVVGNYLVVGQTGLVGNKSSDGTTFSAANPTFGAATYAEDVKWNSVLGKFVLVGGGRSSGFGTGAEVISTTTNGSSYSAGTGATGWCPQTPNPRQQIFVFSNGNMIVCSPETGGVYYGKSTDAGASWAQATGLNSYPYCKQGWVGTAAQALICQQNGTNAFYTTDSGATVTSITHTGVTTPYVNRYLNGNYVVIGATGNAGYKTAAATTAFTTVTSNLASEVGVAAVYTGTNYVLCTATSISTNSAVSGTYTSRTTALFTTALFTGNILGMLSNGAGKVVVWSDNGDVAKSSDDGVTWTRLSAIQNPLRGKAISMGDYVLSNFWLGCDDGTLGYTSDGVAITTVTLSGFSGKKIVAIAGA